MFTFSLLIFIIFTSLYVLFSAAALYHLKHFTLPGRVETRLAISLFLFLSLVLWLLSLLFLFKIPS